MPFSVAHSGTKGNQIWKILSVTHAFTRRSSTHRCCGMSTSFQFSSSPRARVVPDAGRSVITLFGDVQFGSLLVVFHLG